MIDRKKEISIGLFVVSAVIVLAAMIIRFGSADYFAYRDALTLTVRFNFSDGILEKAPVRYSGVDVGRVEAIRLTNDSRQRVLLDLTLKKGITIREKDFITINSLGLMSEMYVEIIPGDLAANAVRAGAVLEGKDPVALQQVVSNAKEVLEQLQKGVTLFAEEETKENIRYSLKNVRQLSEDIKDVSGDLKESMTIMRDIFVENKDNINESISEFKQNIKGMRKAIDSVEHLMARVERGEGLLGKVVMDKKTSDDFSESLEKVKRMLDDFHSISLTIKEGKGAMGMLMTDEEVAEKLKLLILKVEEHPWKLFRKK